jgi:hypothetical protein
LQTRIVHFLRTIRSAVGYEFMAGGAGFDHDNEAEGFLP